jgi:multisubunit Na+/H+ antiporter MnhG subunit
LWTCSLVALLAIQFITLSNPVTSHPVGTSPPAFGLA